MKKSVIALCMVLLLVCSFWNAPVQAETEDTFTVYFFHETSCGSCDGTSEFLEIFNEQVGDIKGQYSYELVTVNAFTESGYEQLETVLESIGLTRDDIHYPVLIIGEDAVSGLDEIETSIREIFTKYGEGYRAEYAEVEASEDEASQTDLFTGVEFEETDSVISFFYTLACDDCDAVKEHLAAVPERITVDGTESSVIIDSYSIAEAEGMEKVRAMFTAYEVPEEEQQVPIIFYRDGYISGRDAILETLNTHLEAGDMMGFSYPSSSAEVDPITFKELPGLALTGFINGFNPCSISILFLLLSLIMMDKSRILKIGFTFIAGKYLMYLILGLGLYSIVSLIDFGIVSKVQDVLNIVLIALAAFLAILNLMDFFAVLRQDYGKVRAQLPEGLRRFNNNIVKKALKDQNSKWVLPLIFVAAMVISAGEFLCTGQIYLGTIIYLLKRGTGSMLITFLAFIIYITCMCLPQCIMILLVRKGANVMSLTESTRSKFPIIKLVNFLLFAGFAVLLYFMSF